MKLTISKALFLTAALALGSAAVHAEGFGITIPFAFQAGSTMFPAGSYMVEATNNVIYVHGKASALVMGVPTASGSTKLAAVFDESSEVKTLESVTMPNGITYTIPAAKPVGLSMTNPADKAVLSKRR